MDILALRAPPGGGGLVEEGGSTPVGQGGFSFLALRAAPGAGFS